jgi:cyclic pyranopterin phosphate synthase
MAALTDPFERRITYLRVSVTDRCDLRCVYCMAEEMTFLPKRQILSLEELDRVCAAFIRLGVRRLRITGGEPLVRRDVMHLFQSLGRRLVPEGAGPGLRELTLTTNGTQLARHAAALYGAGVRRVNVSLDTLDPERFRRITRTGRIGPVLDGLRAAREAGLAVRINTVALRGENEDEFDELLAWCGREGLDLCLIETMPLGETGEDRTGQYLPLSLVRARLRRRWTLVESEYRTGGPARYCTVAETGRRLGFITPMTHNFCESCNRVRLTCTGTLYMCLGQEDAADLRAVLRAGGDEAAPEADDIGQPAAAEGNLLDQLPLMRDSAAGTQQHLVVLVLGIGREEQQAVFAVIVGDLESEHTMVEISAPGEIEDMKPDMGEPFDPGRVRELGTFRCHGRFLCFPVPEGTCLLRDPARNSTSLPEGGAGRLGLARETMLSARSFVRSGISAPALPCRGRAEEQPSGTKAQPAQTQSAQTGAFFS